MRMLGLRVLSVLVLCLPTVVYGIFYPTHWYMYENCGYPLAFRQSTLLGWSPLDLSDIPPNLDCAVSYSASTLGRGIQVRFRSLDTTYDTECQETKLTISDINGLLTPPNGVCGTLTPSTVRTTENTVKVRLQTDGYFHSGDFEMLLTEFSYPTDGKCSGSDFKCSNDICISADLKCNGYNDCDDNSDEIDGCGVTLGVGVIVGIAIAIIFVVLCVSVVVLLFRRRRSQYIAIVGV